MKNIFLFILMIIPITGMLHTAEGQPLSLKSTESEQSIQPQPETPDKIVVTINGHDIKDSDVESRFQWMLQSFGKQKLSDKQIQFYRTYSRYRLIDMLARAVIFEQACQKRGYTISDQDRQKQLNLIIEQTMKTNNWSKDDYEKAVLAGGVTRIEEKHEQLMNDPSFKESVLANKLLELEYPGWEKIEPKAVIDYYADNLHSEFTEKETVRARHILFKTQGLDEASIEQIREKALSVLDEAKQPGSNFSELAKRYSECPSATNGGDVGYFVRNTGPRRPNEQRMLPAFSEAAFALAPGEISHLVKTSIGFHIIQVIDKKPETVLSLEQVRGRIEVELWQKKRKELLDQLFNKLEDEGDVTWYEKKPEKQSQP